VLGDLGPEWAPAHPFGTKVRGWSNRMSQFLQATVYGLLQGCIFGLVAVGFSLVWGVMNVVNLAHGAFVLMGAYMAFELNQAVGLDPFLSMAPAAVVLFLFG